MKLIKKFVFFLSLTVLASLISCKSTKTGSGETTIFTTDWIESSYSDTDKLGHFFTTPEIGQFSIVTANHPNLCHEKTRYRKI